MIFEKATANDILDLVWLRIDYLLEDYGEMTDDIISNLSNNLPTYFFNHLNKDLFVFVCRDADNIVGCSFLCVSEKPSNPTFINGRTGTVLNVYTKPEYRRKGIAGKLIKMLLLEAERLSLDFVELKATDAGHGLYKSLGFEDAESKYHNMKYIIDSINLF
ncbi:MAG: GNAT family N-acetyltransferase [Oscillospiraceae bacterium]|nr:GNAT family N-acetyltransferase [Oscillospiraceae bacterium]